MPYPLDYGSLCSKLHGCELIELVVYAMHYDKTSDSCSPAMRGDRVHYYDLDVYGGPTESRHGLEPTLELTDLTCATAFKLGLCLSEVLGVELWARGVPEDESWIQKYQIYLFEY